MIKSKDGRENKSKNKNRRHKLAHCSGSSEFKIDQGFVQAILVKRVGNLAKITTAIIPYFYMWQQENGSSVFDQAGIKFIILIPYQIFIKKTNFIENLTFIASERNGIYFFRIFYSFP